MIFHTEEKNLIFDLNDQFYPPPPPPFLYITFMFFFISNIGSFF